VEKFDSDGLIELEVMSKHDHTHATLTDDAIDSVFVGERLAETYG